MKIIRDRMGFNSDASGSKTFYNNPELSRYNVMENIVSLTDSNIHEDPKPWAFPKGSF